MRRSAAKGAAAIGLLQWVATKIVTKSHASYDPPNA